MTKIVKMAFIIYFSIFSTGYAQDGVWGGVLDVLFGEKYTHALTALNNRDSLDSDDLAEVSDAFIALSQIANAFERGEDVSGQIPQSDEDKKAIIEQFKTKIEDAKRGLTKFSVNVSTGKYEDLFDKEFWNRCQGELTSAINLVNSADPDAEKENRTVKVDKFQPLDDCRAEADEISAKLGQRIALLDEQIIGLDKEIKKIDDQLKNNDLTAEERAELEKKRKQAQDERDQKQAEKQKAEEAKSGIDLWLLVSGLVMIVAGAVLVFFYDIVNGWGLIAGGVGMVVDAVEGNDAGTSPSPSAGSGTTASSTTDGQSAISKAVEDGRAGGDPAPEETSAVTSSLEELGFKPVAAVGEPGNFMLFHNSATKVIAVYKIKPQEEIFSVDLTTVETSPGLIRPELVPTDISGVTNWSMQTKSEMLSGNGVSLTFDATFSPDTTTKVALLESTDSKGNVVFALAELAPLLEVFD